MRKLFCTVGLITILSASPAIAGQLPAESLLCLTEPQIKEALKAIDRNDAQWLRSIKGCFETQYTAKIQRIDCSGRICQIRIWPEPGDDESVVVYAVRSALQ